MNYNKKAKLSNRFFIGLAFLSLILALGTGCGGGGGGGGSSGPPGGDMEPPDNDGPGENPPPGPTD